MYTKRDKPPLNNKKWKQMGWNTGIDRTQFNDKHRQKRFRRLWREHLRKKKQEYNT